MFRKLKKKWKRLGLILIMLISGWINVYLYLRVPKHNISCEKAENVTVRLPWKEVGNVTDRPSLKNAGNVTERPSWKEIYWMNKYKRLQNLWKLKRSTLLGPGANGIGIKVDTKKLSLEDKKKLDLGQKKHGFNTFVSDIVSYHRKLPDLRYPECRHLVYPSNLPAASIIIIFRDELLSILLRTIYSIVENTPDNLIREIILVDDGSTLSDLRATLDIHIASLPKVSVIHLKTSQGLMVARQTGIERARSQYFVVMDSHMEVVTGWLDPLIHRLVQQPRALLCSKIGAIDKDDFRVSFGDGGKTKYVGFNFHLDEQWNRYDTSFLQKRSNLTQPLETAMVQGMFIAMRKDFFLQLGGFDTGMQIWGAEQMELSIKVWTCGGTVEIIPCSLAAHLYRHTPWAKNGTARARNRLRLTDVWLDEYKNGIFHMHKHRMIDYGNVEDRKKIREENNCKPFSYLLQKLREFTSEFYMPLNPKARGRIRNVFRKNYCLDPDKSPHTKPILYKCHYQFNQYFILTESSDIRVEGHFCLVPGPSSDTVLIFDNCSNIPARFTPVRKWTYEKDKTIRNRGRCLTADSGKDIVSLQPCQAGPTQQWIWEW